MNDFYFSWSRQDTPVEFLVGGAEADEFVLTNGRRVYDFISTSFQAKFVRPEFTEKVKQSSHWQYEKMVPNQLSDSADIWS